MGSWRDSTPDDHNSNANLRAKWSGPSGTVLYENPNVENGAVNVEGVAPDARFQGFECDNINWLTGGAYSATVCYHRVMESDECGKRFMTWNSINNGCGCYPTEMT